MNRKKNQHQNYAAKVPRKFVYLFLVLLGLLPIQFSVMAQNTSQIINIKGTVVDDKGEPIIGASILVKGTGTGTVTDIDGHFTLKAVTGQSIVVSYVGYLPQTIKVTPDISKIVLQEDNAKLQEVVVVGYNTVKRANLTGAVASVDAKEVQDFPAPDLSTVLAGTMPGVHVSTPTGNPIGTSSITVRINGTFSTTAEPLYVIDGFIRDVDAFNMLDPSEIASISVLKDASAAVYGVRGANGVVLVTTKKGKEGKPQISYSGSVGVDQGVDMPRTMSAYQQGVALNDLWRQEIKYDGASASNFTMFSDAELQKMKSLNYDWLKMGWHDAMNTRHTLNVSGGSKRVRYFVGASYMYANGNFSNLSANRYGIRFGVDADITKDLKGSFSMDYSERDTNQPLNQLDTEYDRMYGTFSELARTSKFIPAYINGLPVNTGGGINALEMFNSGSYRKSNSSDVSAGLSLTYTFPQITGLKLNFTGNYSRTSTYGKQIASPYYIYGFETDANYPHLYSTTQLPTSDSNYMKEVTNGDKIYESADFAYSYQIDPQISYSNKFGNSSIDAKLMYEQSEGGGEGLAESRQTVVIPSYEEMAGYSSSSQSTSSSTNTLSRRQSFIGIFNYNYADKYILESSARYDGSTNFAPGHRWGLFPAVSAGWRVSEEPFFKDNVSFMNNLKLRASAGRLGNDKATANQYRQSYVVNGEYLIGGGALSTLLKPMNGGLVYYDATWEKTDSYDMGVDMSFFNQLNASIDGFFKHTFDILDTPQSSFPQSSGITGSIPKTNYGIQNAWGGELEVSWNKQVSHDWTLNLKANFAYAMNFVVKKYQNPGVVGTWADENGKVSQGEVGYESMGIARTQADINKYIAYLESDYIAYHGHAGTVSELGISQADMKPGMLMYRDVGSAAYKDANGNWHDGAPDGIIDNNDQRIISKYSFNPYDYSFTLGATWKNLKFAAMFTGSFGSNVFYEKGFWTDASGGGRTGDFLSQYSNQLEEWYGNYWTENNINAKYPRLDAYSLRGYRSTFWMRNGAEMHLKTLNLSYNMPKSFATMVGVSQFRVYAQASNIWTIINPYPYKDASVGFWSDYPMIRTVNLGVNLTF